MAFVYVCCYDDKHDFIVVYILSYLGDVRPFSINWFLCSVYCFAFSINKFLARHPSSNRWHPAEIYKVVVAE